MTECDEWLGLTDAVYRSNGEVSYWQLYTATLRRQIEARRQGRHWQVRMASLDCYLDQRREAQ